MTQKRWNSYVIGDSSAVFKIEQYSLPEIISSLREMGLIVDEEDITKPNCARITLLLECILYLFTPWRAEIIEAERNNANNSLQPLVGSETGIITDVIIVFNYFQALLKDIQFTEFTLSDLTAPTTQRLLRILNVVVNYARFSDLCWAVFEPLSSDSYQLGIEVEELEARVDELESAIIERKRQRKEEEPEVRKYENLVSDIEHEIQELRIQNESLTSEHEALKLKRQELKDSLQETQCSSLEEMELSNHYQRLADYDVERYRDLSADIKERLDAVRRELIINEQLQASLTAKCAREKVLIQTLQKSVDLLNSIHHTKNSFNRTKKTNESVEKEFSTLEIESKELGMQCYYAQRELAQLENRKKRLNEQQEKKRESMKLFWDNIHKSDQDLEAELKQLAMETQAEIRKGQEIDLEVENLRKTQKIRRQAVMDRLVKLKLHIELKIYQNTLNL